MIIIYTYYEQSRRVLRSQVRLKRLTIFLVTLNVFNFDLKSNFPNNISKALTGERNFIIGYLYWMD